MNENDLVCIGYSEGKNMQGGILRIVVMSGGANNALHYLFKSIATGIPND